MARQQQLQAWFQRQDVGYSTWKIEPVAGDASFRRYFRATGDNRSLILLDSPPAQEPLEPFVTIALDWHTANIAVPAIVHYDLEHGFAAIADAGNIHLEQVTGAQKRYAYGQCIEQLHRIGHLSQQLPQFDVAYMMGEMRLYCQWALPWLGLRLDGNDSRALEGLFAWLAEYLQALPQCVIHRDYHSRNIMVQDSGITILDFQDAMHGPYMYDIASLLADAYVEHSKDFVDEMLQLYMDNKHTASMELDYACTVMQRHIKVLGIFCRLAMRDGKNQYLQYLPRICSYVQRASQCVAQYYPQQKPGIAVLSAGCGRIMQKIGSKSNQDS